MKIDCPAYFTVDRDTFTLIRSVLPPAQTGKLLGAMAEYFFTGTMDRKLPKDVQMMFNMAKPSLTKRRAAAINKMRNRLNNGLESVSITFEPCISDDEDE